MLNICYGWKHIIKRVQRPLHQTMNFCEVNCIDPLSHLIYSYIMKTSQYNLIYQTEILLTTKMKLLYLQELSVLPGTKFDPASDNSRKHVFSPPHLPLSPS